MKILKISHFIQIFLNILKSEKKLFNEQNKLHYINRFLVNYFDIFFVYNNNLQIKKINS